MATGKMAVKKGQVVAYKAYHDQTEKLLEVQEILAKYYQSRGMVRVMEEKDIHGLVLPCLVLDIELLQKALGAEELEEKEFRKKLNGLLKETGCEMVSAGYRFGRGSDVERLRPAGTKSGTEGPLLWGWETPESRKDIFM